MARNINKDNLSYLTFTKSFDRTQGQPLDPTSIYSSLTAAEDYAKTDKAYVGQIISVVTESGVEHYSIEDTEGTLKEITENGVGEKFSGGGEIFNDYTNNRAPAEFSHAGGHASEANHSDSFVHGSNLRTSASQQAVFGKFNKENDKALFIIGNGTGTENTSRANAFEIIQVENEVSLKIGDVTLTATQLKKLKSLLDIDIDKLQQLLQIVGVYDK